MPATAVRSTICDKPWPDGHASSSTSASCGNRPTLIICKIRQGYARIQRLRSLKRTDRVRAAGMLGGRTRRLIVKENDMPVTIGALRERAPGETRVSLVPEIADKLAAAGVRVLLEHGAGTV